MRKLLKLFLIMLLTIVWTASRAQEIAMDFTDNSGWNIPDKDKTTNKPQTFGKDNNAITLSGEYHYVSVSTGPYLLLNREATLTFSQFNFDVERIVVIGYDSKVSQSIYVGENLVSDQVNGGLGPRTFWINEEYQNAGNVYTLKVTYGTAHIKRIEIYRKGSFAPEGKAVFFVGGTDKGTNNKVSKINEITKDGVTISGKEIALAGVVFNDYGTYEFYKDANFTISVKTGTITKIEFTGNKSLEYLDCNG
ncbi:hypothetical protein [Prevotella merdae]|uniref:hypothetical protein n=1 Tax=Prevotella merdae TaxID=2079531 RepID=UPI003F7EE901